MRKIRVYDIISISKSGAELSLYPPGYRGDRTVERVEFASRQGEKLNR